MRLEIRFLSFETVVALHLHQIEKFGGEPGVRDENLLSSAIGMAEAGFGDQYFHKSLFEMAAAYLFHIVKNHPFIDGNKRAGTAAALAFLRGNGYRVDVSEDALADFVWKLAADGFSKADAAVFLEEHLQPVG